MSSSQDNDNIVRSIIDKDQWWDVLSRFIDVLNINLFLINEKGSVILPPIAEKYGGRLLRDRSLGFDFIDDEVNILSHFHLSGEFLKSSNKYGLHLYALPLEVSGLIIGYLVVGPVILNKRIDSKACVEIAQKDDVDAQELLNELSSIRVISHLMVQSILSLLSKIVKDNVELSKKELENKNLEKSPEYNSLVNKEMRELTDGIYADVRTDKFLVSLLDVALKITNTECGSIMVCDKDEIVLRVSRGIDASKTSEKRVRIGESIAGVAAQEKESFVINGVEGDNRIKKYLTRNNIKKSLVMPLIEESKVFGVLNLHTKSDQSRIDENLENLNYLTKLISSAL